ncbi:MAG: tudor domain-containing protein [Myxococcota bacterium]|nr:tudor domain-containing protein [Myxococcota bacterium]
MSQFDLGDEVLAPWANDGFLYPAILVELSPSQGHVAFLDGDESGVELSSIRQGVIGPGLHVQVNWKGRGKYYGGTVQKRCGQAVFIHYEDGSKEWTTTGQCRVQAELALSMGDNERACAYCGRIMDAKQALCNSCGAPRRKG